jgi:hypothetical protein
LTKGGHREKIGSSMNGYEGNGYEGGGGPGGGAFDLEREIAANLKDQLYSRRPFFALPLGMLGLSFSTKVKAMGVNGETLCFNPDWLRGSFRSGAEELIVFILHSLYHCLLGHIWQGKDHDPPLWDLACDLVVWRLIGESYGEYLPGPYGDLCGEAAELAGPAMTAAELCPGLEKSPVPPLREKYCLDDHRLWLPAQRKEEDRRLLEFFGAGQGGRGAESLEKRWSQIGKKSPPSGKTRRGGIGEGEKNLSMSISLGEPKRIAYRDFLLRFAVMGETASVNTDEFQYAYYLYGLDQYGNVPIIEASEYQERRGIDELGIVIDTSASCSRELTKLFLEETRNIILAKNLFFRRFNLRIILCDNRVRRDDRICGAEELSAYIENLEIPGQGGTDFRPAFAYIDALRREGEFSRLRGILYFTDGRGIYPAEKPEYETAFIFIKDRYDDIDTPDWALKLTLDTGPA